MQEEKIYEGNQVEIFRVSPEVCFRKASLARGQCNSVYFVGPSGVAVLDVPTREAAHEFVSECKLLFNKPIRTVLLTHGDGDHVDGLPAFLDKDVTVYCSRRLFSKLAPVGKGYKAAFVAVDGMMRMSLPGGLELELFTLPDITHSHWDMFVRIPSEKTLCTGDAVVEYPTLYFHNANTFTWSAQLKALAERNDRIVLPGHGPIYPYSYVGEVAEYLETVYRAARQCFKRFKPVELEKISVEKINAVLSAYFAEEGADARELIKKAGEADAVREVRMALWHLVREEMR